jgi:hypothetical protein
VEDQKWTEGNQSILKNIRLNVEIERARVARTAWAKRLEIRESKVKKGEVATKATDDDAQQNLFTTSNQPELKNLPVVVS